MLLRQLKSGGPYKNFTYLIACKETKKGAIIDPALEVNDLVSYLNEEETTLVYIINTHNHPDHTMNNSKLQEKTGADIVQHKYSGSGDVKVDHGDELGLGYLTLKFLYTPGHTNHDICVLVNGELFTGDTLFVGKVGGTSDKEGAKAQFESLKKLMELSDDINVWPGHDNGERPSSTIGEEKENNPFCLRLHDFKEFYNLKENWLEFKKKHGIV